MRPKRVVSSLLITVPLAAAALVPVGASGSPSSPAASTPASLRPPHSDFDGDGRDDIVAALFAWDTPEPDAIIVRYAPGLPQQLLMPPGGPSTVRGQTPLASGDFNHDGYDDLAMGRPADNLVSNGQTIEMAGSVWIFSGGPAGLDPAGRQLGEETAGIPGSAEPGDQFGASLAVGDVNADGRDDLAIGVPMEDVGSVRDAGSILVLRGSASGLVASSGQQLHENSANVPSSAQPDDNFGTRLAIGDVTGDRKSDVVVTAPGDDLNGAIFLLRGSSSGVTTTGADWLTVWNLDHTPPTQVVGIRDVGAGDTNGDGYAEVLVGAPQAIVGSTRSDAGAVWEIRGRATGLASTGARVVHQDTSGAPEVAEVADRLGYSIAVGDATGDGRADVLVGVPGEDRNGRREMGAIMLFRGSSAGLTGTGSQYLDQNSSGVPSTAEAGDEFGDTVSLLERSGDQRLDAVVGTQYENRDVMWPSGTVTWLRATNSGFVAYGFLDSSELSTPFSISNFGYSIVE